jgi:hypothetical protein
MERVKALLLLGRAIVAGGALLRMMIEGAGEN